MGGWATDSNGVFRPAREHDNDTPIMTGGNVAVIFGVGDLLNPDFPYIIEERFISCRPQFFSRTGFSSVAVAATDISAIPNNALTVSAITDDKTCRLQFAINQLTAFSGFGVYTVTLTSNGGDAYPANCGAL